MTLSAEQLDTIVNRGVTDIISRDEFVRLLQAGQPLRLKMGFDPSRADIHLGHVVGLRKLRQLQELGHRVILIVGDWTAQIGDPSGQSATRPMLTHDEVMANAETYLRQFFRVVDEERTQVVRQSEWFGDFTLADVINLTKKFTVAQFLQRADFAQRFAEQRPIALTEFLYPLLQAYDSVAIESDVEFGGTDQMFNLLVGRELQVMMGQRPQQCFLMPMLVGTDGVQKMSKSLGNYVAVDEPPADMFGKIMSLSDGLILNYFEFLTDVPQSDLDDMAFDLKRDAVNPMDYKKRLAREITSQFHGDQAASAAQSHFERVVQGGGVPDEMPEIAIKALWDRLSSADNVSAIEGNVKSLVTRADGRIDTLNARCDLLLVAAEMADSNSEARRLISQGAVELIHLSGNSQRLRDSRAGVTVVAGDVLRVGRRRFVRFTDSKVDSP